MQVISVRAVAGRVARKSPKGDFIPHDRYVPVEKTEYVARLLHVHGDIELEPEKPKAAPAK